MSALQKPEDDAKQTVKPDRVRILDFSERWMQDGLRAIEPPGAMGTVEVDMSNASALLDTLNAERKQVTFTHFVVRAAALALARHPDLHQLTAGIRRLTPGCVDICLSISGEGAVTPVMIIKDAASKSIIEIAAEVRTRAKSVREQDRKVIDLLRRWGWLIPFSFMRRGLIRHLLCLPGYRRKVSGTFQVSVVPGLDSFAPFLFNTAAVLGSGFVRDNPVAIEGRVEIRPMLMLACCIDHKTWHGLNLATFLQAVKQILEQETAESDGL